MQPTDLPPAHAPRTPIVIPERVAQRALSSYTLDVSGCHVSTYSTASHGYAQIGWQEPGTKRSTMTLCHPWVAVTYRAPVRHFNTAASIGSAPDEAPMFGALCVSNPEDWVGDDNDARAAAATVCIGCPVRRECAQAALDGKEKRNVWAGVDLTMELKAVGRHKLQQVVDGVEPAPARRVWIDAEDDLIRDALNGSPEETAAAKEIGVSVYAVRMRRREMNFTRPRHMPWTDAEDAMIIAGEPASEVAKLQGRSESPINRRRAYLRAVGRL